jgi:hypothetical protein
MPIHKWYLIFILCISPMYIFPDTGYIPNIQGVIANLKVTLNKIFHTDVGAGKSLLELKRDLIKFKRTGEIFIRESISELQEDQPFQLYYFATPNPRSFKDPFPIPVNVYKENNKKRKAIFQTQYERYYGEAPPIEYFRNNSFKVFWASEFVWVYKNI